MLKCLCPALLLSLLAGQVGAENLPQTNLPRVTLHIRHQPLEAQLATTPKQRQIGLMQSYFSHPFSFKLPFALNSLFP